MHSSFIEGEIVNINTLEVVRPVLMRFTIILLKLLIENVENDKKKYISKQNNSNYNLFKFVINKIHSRPWKMQRRSTFPLKNTINKNTIFSIADHIKIRWFKINLYVPTRNKTWMSHVDINFPTTWISSNYDSILSNHIFKISWFETTDGSRCTWWCPLNWWWTCRCWLKGQQCPSVTIWCSWEIGHDWGKQTNARFQNGYIQRYLQWSTSCCSMLLWYAVNYTSATLM